MEHIGSALLGSSTQLDEKMDTLKRKLQVLESKEDDVKEELKQVEFSFSTKKPRKEVQNWLAELERMKTEVQQKEQEVQERRSWWRNQELCKSVDKLTTEVAELTEHSKFPRGLTVASHEREGVPFPTTRLIGEMFEKHKNMIRECLVAGGDSIIGIYGMGGVGKTTLLTHIHNDLLTRQSLVSWVTVSRDFSIRKLQRDIAKAMRLDISEEDDERKRAAQLAWAFQRKKNFILILDDVWDIISLEKVGICVGENGCKLVLTTRSIEVCRMINCDKIIKVEPLSKVDSWALFVKTLGNETLFSGQIKSIAKSLVAECDGLPLGIIVMAGSMRGLDDIHEWSNALEEIREAKYRNDGMDFYDVFCILKHSYDKLKDPKVQECLLYCSLFPEDELIERDQLIEYFINEELIDGTMNSRQSKIHKGHTILNKLENVCLLERQWNADGQKYVRMHDLIRDMAIKISRGSHRFLVQAGMNLIGIPDEEEWSEDLVRVSLMNNRISDIPDYVSPKCPALLTLLLQRNAPLKVIPDNFLKNMKRLIVLDLSDTNIESLPTSISHLESLTSLLLRNCKRLRYVPSLANQKALRRLDLRGTRISEVPTDMEKLINLRYLNLRECIYLKTIPAGILSKLSHIEFFEYSHLSIRLEEIKSWRNLATFFGLFDHIDELNTWVGILEEMKPFDYTILVDCKSNSYSLNTLFDKQVFLFENIHAEDAFVLPTGIQLLSLEYCHGITSLSHVAGLRKAADLRMCEIYGCCGMRHVLCSCCHNLLFSQSLEILKLEVLPALTNLIEIERGTSSSSVLPSGNIFTTLRVLEICRCDELKTLFLPSLLPQLQSLEELDVSYCDNLVEIISEQDGYEEATDTIISLPVKLRSVTLRQLPKLDNFCSYSIKLTDSLKEIRVNGCLMLTTMNLLWEKPYPPLSLSIYSEPKWWNSLVWKYPGTKDILQRYATFTT